ncbi:unnamed protein product [Victoria cruziana]
MLRNFRKDGHVWKKKNDGKTVKEAHEHLKVGDDERIHVYYAHGQEKPNFVRRCYWLLDKHLERIVLVHYREVLEDDAQRKDKEPMPFSGQSHILPDSPLDPTSVSCCSGNSVKYGSPQDPTIVTDPYTCSVSPISGASANQMNETMYSGKQEFAINDAGFDLDDLFEPQLFSTPVREEAFLGDATLGTYEDSVMYEGEASGVTGFNSSQVEPHGTSFTQPIDRTSGRIEHEIVKGKGNHSCVDHNSSLLGPTGMPLENAFQSQESFSKWMNSVMDPSAELLVEEQLQISASSGGESNSHLVDQPQQDIIFSVTEVVPLRGLATEQTKVLVTGHFHKFYSHFGARIVCVFGDTSVPAEIVQAGVIRCVAPPQSSGIYSFYLSIDGHTPISQIMSFEYYPVPSDSAGNGISGPKFDESKWNDFEVKKRLAHLLFSTSSGVSLFTSKVSPKTLNEAKRFSQSILLHEKDWISLKNSMEYNESSFLEANVSLLDLTLKSKLQEWLLEKLIEGRGATVRDHQGQGVIHLCVILDYGWAIHLITQAGISIDFRDASGWTALHWAANFGRNEMVAVLLREGGDPSLVSDPTPEYPGGCTAADLAFKNGYDGLAAYLAEKALTEHFRKMSLAGNVQGNLQRVNSVKPTVNLTEEDLCLKDSLAAMHTAADAASRIQEAFRQRSLKQRTKLARETNPEAEAARIVAALRIQHAFQRHQRRKQLEAAVRIQHKFRVWKARKDFLNVRRQVIKIQAAFRGHQVRKQYRKILWSVGVLEKVILRWRLKRKGLRGHHMNPKNHSEAKTEENNAEEDFFRISRKQAEERIERAVTRVQSMFRSHKARVEYRKMKQLYEKTEPDEPIVQD